MRIAALVLLFAIAVAAAPQSAGAEPPRRMVSAAEQPAWAAVGRLTVAGQGYCTATLVGPDLVLTAGHCVIDRRRGGAVAPGRVHFLAGFRAGSYIADRQGARVMLMPGYDRAARDVARDLALVRLHSPLPAALAPLPVHRGARRDAPLTVASYGIDRAQILSVESGCRMRRRIGAVLVTDCDGVPGVSGAPLLQRVGGRLVVTGVASAVRDSGRARMPQGAVLAAEATQARMARLGHGAAGGIDLARVPVAADLLNRAREISSAR